jgi:hypothetical protein
MNDKTDSDKELQIILSVLDDCRRLIAAGKVQRWDVVKWGVTVNVALATVAAAIQFAVPFSLIPVLLAVLVAFVSWLLVLHYNRRLTGARDTTTHLVDQIKRKGIDYDTIIGKSVAFDYSQGPEYDKQELTVVAPERPDTVTSFRELR